MYCPNCGQQQVSEEMRFCSRCGLALSGLAEWLAGGSLQVNRDERQVPEASSPRRKGTRRAAKLMFFGGVLFPVFFAFSLAIEEGAPMVVPFLVFFIGLVMLLYALLFSDKTAPESYREPKTSAFDSTAARGSLPPPTSIPIPARQHVRTNELAHPPSVTENTTRLLDNE